MVGRIHAMDEMVAVHNFESSKNKLKEFSKNNKDNFELDVVKEKGNLWFVSHKVTGEELNERLNSIQQILVCLNDKNNKTIEEFLEVYNALESLDKGYIQGIAGNLKEIQETSKSIQIANNKMDTAIRNQNRSILEQVKFQKSIVKNKHYKDIDQLWNDAHKWHKETLKLSNSIHGAVSESQNNTKAIHELHTISKTTSNDLADLKENLQKQTINLEEMKVLINELEKIAHIQDIDEMWNQMEVQNDKIIDLTKHHESVNEQISIYEHQIDELSQYQKNLNDIEHLQDVDQLWEANELHTHKIADLEKLSAETSDVIQNNQDTINAAIDKLIEQNHTALQDLTTKIKYAYILAGCSIVFALIEFMILFLG